MPSLRARNVPRTRGRYSELFAPNLIRTLMECLLSEREIHRIRDLVTVILGGIETDNLQLSLEAVRRLEHELLRCAKPPAADNMTLAFEEADAC